MGLPLVLLILYSVAIIAAGLWLGRFVRGPADFFVAGRRLPWFIVGATVLAANIGAGTTIGATGLAYRDGLSAWWWNGAAGLGTLVLAFWVGPRMWAHATERGHLTVGDFLEERYDARVRGIVAVLIWIGTLAILSGQLIAGAAVLEVVAGLPRWMGVVIGGVVMTTVFTSGGLLGSAWINLLQLIVILAGFAVTVPLVLSRAGGFEAIGPPDVGPEFWNVMHSTGAFSGWTLLLLLGPGFVVSPGLIQKAYGAQSRSAVRTGLAVAGVLQLVFSFAPVIIGMSARVLYPAIEGRDLVLPTMLLNAMPVWLGGLMLSAVFSAEVSTCDAILFMLATSLSKDLYQRFVNPGATPAQVLRVARFAALGGGLLGMLLATQFPTVADALTVFYALLGATLFVPVIGALLVPRAGAREALAAIALGMTTLLLVHFGTSRTGWLNPSLWGIVAAAIAFAVSAAVRRRA